MSKDVRTIALETDTALSELIPQLQRIEISISHYRKMLEKNSSRKGTVPYRNIEECIAKEESNKEVLLRKIEPLELIYSQYGWERYYYVPGGHVHYIQCSTLRIETNVLWLVDYAALSERELVEDAGERACTVCFPSAPVHKPTKLSVYTRNDDEKAQRQKEIAQKRAKADSEAVKDENGQVVFKSLRAANLQLLRDISDIVYFYAYTPEYRVSLDSTRTQKNPINAEQHFEQWNNSKDIYNLNRSVRRTIKLMQAKGGLNVLEGAMKRFVKEVNDASKKGFLFPEGFNLPVFEEHGMYPVFRYSQ